MARKNRKLEKGCSEKFRLGQACGHAEMIGIVRLMKLSTSDQGKKQVLSEVIRELKIEEEREGNEAKLEVGKCQNSTPVKNIQKEAAMGKYFKISGLEKEKIR